MTVDDAETRLDTAFRLGKRGDDVYAALIEAHRGLTLHQSHRLNARLVLMLANQVGDPAVVLDAIERARSGVTITDVDHR
ncbi:MAG: DUF2783 domain-containing protein [Hyphomicrobiaceae bacterium]